MKIEKCRFCQSLLPTPKIIPILDSNVSLYSCQTCSLMQSPENKSDYSSGNLIKYYQERQIWIKKRHKLIFDRIESILLKKENIYFLDIGCGIGFSLVEAESRHWEATGIEPNKDLASFAVENLKVNITNSYFSKEIAKHQKFDFILIDNVVEHLSTPRDLIHEASSILEHNGILLVIVPPVDYLRKLLSKIKFVRERITSATLNIFNDTYEHINFVTPTSMQYLAESLDLELLNVNFHHHKFFEIFQKTFGLESGYYFIKKK